MALKSESSKERIKAELIIDVIGKPPEHLTETLQKIVDAIKKESGVEVTGHRINEPQPMKDEPGFYTNFAEIEVEVEDVLYIAMLIFKYMPANVDLISPEKISLTNNGWNEILNELVRRLHAYDEIARVLQIEKGLLERNLREILEEQRRNQDKKTEQSPEKSKKKQTKKKD